MTWEAGLGNALKYDAENHLNPVTGYVYSYDGDGHRVEKNNGGSITYYWYDDGSNVISTTGTLVRDYVYFNGRRLAYFAPSSGSQHYYWSDHLRSASVMSNSSGDTIEWEADYYPFGTPNVLNNYLENYFRFSDYQWDPEMGYYYASAREDAPRLGRFMMPDPLGGHLEDPQTLNKYTYVRNSPTTLTDPTGLDIWLRGCGKDSSTCQNNFVGTTDKDGNFTRTHITGDQTGMQHLATMASL
jgi:RHS repeat-associated protein